MAPSLLEQNVWDVLDSAARNHPSKQFVVSGEVTLTYADVERLSSKLATQLARTGIRSGDRVTTWLPTCYEWVVYAFALAKLGAVNVLANTRYTEREIEYILRHSGSKAIIHPTMAFRRDYSASVSRVRDVLAQEGQDLLAVGVEVGGDDLIRAADNLKYDENGDVSPPGGTEPLYIIYTSGTTGSPKGSITRHGAALQNAFNSGERQGFTAEDRLLCFLPLFHCFGAVNALLNVLTHGATLVLQTEFVPDETLEIIQDLGITTVYAVPTNLIMLMERHKELGEAAPSLETWTKGIVGGGEVSTELADYVTNVLGVTGLVNAYGMTEATAIICQTEHSDRLEDRLFTSGKPMPGVSIDVRSESGDVGSNRGEILVRGFNVHAGYFGLPKEQDSSSLPDGWFATGDLGEVDTNGRCRILGRSKDMYKSSGFNVYPAEIEIFLQSHPGIAQVAVVGVPDRTLQETGIAYVILEKGHRLTEGEVLEFARQGLAKFKVPSRVVFVDDFPRSQATLKVQKHVLKDMATS